MHNKRFPEYAVLKFGKPSDNRRDMANNIFSFYHTTLPTGKGNQLMYFRSCICALSLLLPHAIAYFIPCPWIALIICLIGQALIGFPLCCGLYRQKLSLAFSKLWSRFFLCGLDLMLRFSIAGFVCMLPFCCLQTLIPLLAAFLGGAGVVAWLLICTRWICLIRFAHLPHRQVFHASANAVRKNHLYAFSVLLRAACCFMLIIFIPNGLLLLMKTTSQFSPDSRTSSYLKPKGEFT